MDKTKLYAMILDEYAMASFCSFTKRYYGTLEDIRGFAEACERTNNNADIAKAFKEYIAGNKDAQYNAAYTNHRFITPVKILPAQWIPSNCPEFEFTNYKWEHLNIYGCPYNMMADKITVNVAFIQEEKECSCCIKAKFINLSVESLIDEGRYDKIKNKFWGHPNVFKVDMSDPDNIITEYRFYVSMETAESIEELIDKLKGKPIDFKNIVNDVFGDG